jgi:hypothetical protein
MKVNTSYILYIDMIWYVHSYHMIHTKQLLLYTCTTYTYLRTFVQRYSTRTRTRTCTAVRVHVRLWRYLRTFVRKYESTFESTSLSISGSTTTSVLRTRTRSPIQARCNKGIFIGAVWTFFVARSWYARRVVKHSHWQSILIVHASVSGSQEFIRKR